MISEPVDTNFALLLSNQITVEEDYLRKLFFSHIVWYRSGNCASEVLILRVTWINLMLGCSKMLDFCMKRAASSTPLVQDQCEHVCTWIKTSLCCLWHVQVTLISVSCVQVTPSCVTGGAWESSCLRCWWDSHPSWPPHLLRLRSRSVMKKKHVPFFGF